MLTMTINFNKWVLKTSIFNIKLRLSSAISIAFSLLVFSNTSYASVMDKYKYTSFQDNREHYGALADNKAIVDGKDYTINEMGESSSQDPSARDYIIYLHDRFLPSKHPIVVDIGSGLGGWTRVMTFLGYKVFSIDKDQMHLDFQKRNFCNIAKNTFLDDLLSLDNYDYSNLKEDCKEIIKNVSFIKWRFENDSIPDQLPSQPWNMAIVDNVFQFMNESELIRSLKLIENKISKNGVVYLNYTHWDEKSAPPNYNDNYKFLIKYMKKLGFKILEQNHSTYKNKPEHNQTCSIFKDMNDDERLKYLERFVIFKQVDSEKANKINHICSGNILTSTLLLSK